MLKATEGELLQHDKAGFSGRKGGFRAVCAAELPAVSAKVVVYKCENHQNIAFRMPREFSASFNSVARTVEHEARVQVEAEVASRVRAKKHVRRSYRGWRRFGTGQSAHSWKTSLFEIWPWKGL